MTTKMDVSLLKENPDNPRTITDAKFQALVKSVKEFPEMLDKRPIANDIKKRITFIVWQMR